jgi:hypothetical protein
VDLPASATFQSEDILTMPPYSSGPAGPPESDRSFQSACFTRAFYPSTASSHEQEIIRCQRVREIVESDLIRSCGNDGGSVNVTDGEVRERLHTRHAAKLDFVMLTLAEVFDGVLRPEFWSGRR